MLFFLDKFYNNLKYKYFKKSDDNIFKYISYENM